MATRLRLLIYKGHSDTLQAQRFNELRNSGPGGEKVYISSHGDLHIKSIELDPTRLTIRELLRVLFTRESKEAS